MRGTPQFLKDATQIAYLWTERGCYGSRAGALRALRRRRSAAGTSGADRENALERGLAVIAMTSKLIPDGPSLVRLSEADAGRLADDVSRKVRMAIPGSTSEMVDYALGMMLWMPVRR
jgi:hypothetical protein